MSDEKTKHTEGPWFAGATATTYGHHEVFGADQCLVANVPAVVQEYEGNTKRPARANARLISAAPEMLAALELAHETLQGLGITGLGHPLFGVSLKVAQALAKARGQS